MGDLNLMNTDSEGRMVIGRDATLQNFGVASSYPNDPSRIDLAVGRDLNAVSVGINHGSATYGRNLSGTLTNPLPNGTLTRATTPFDVGALFEALAIRSSFWADLDPEGTISGPEYGALTLQGTNATRNVFTLSASKLASAQEIRIRVPFGATTLINVTGETYASSTVSAIAYWNGSAYVQLGRTTACRPSSRRCGRRRCGTGPTRPTSTSGRTPPGRARSWRRARSCTSATSRSTGRSSRARCTARARRTSIRRTRASPTRTPCPPEPPIPTPTPTPTDHPVADARADDHAHAHARADHDADARADHDTHARADRHYAHA